jgi:hypothetical protein
MGNQSVVVGYFKTCFAVLAIFAIFHPGTLQHMLKAGSLVTTAHAQQPTVPLLMGDYSRRSPPSVVHWYDGLLGMPGIFGTGEPPSPLPLLSEIRLPLPVAEEEKLENANWLANVLSRVPLRNPNWLDGRPLSQNVEDRR